MRALSVADGEEGVPESEDIDDQKRFVEHIRLRMEQLEACDNLLAHNLIKFAVAVAILVLDQWLETTNLQANILLQPPALILFSSSAAIVASVFTLNKQRQGAEIKAACLPLQSGNICSEEADIYLKKEKNSALIADIGWALTATGVGLTLWSSKSEGASEPPQEAVSWGGVSLNYHRTF